MSIEYMQQYQDGYEGTYADGSRGHTLPINPGEYSIYFCAGPIDQ